MTPRRIFAPLPFLALGLALLAAPAFADDAPPAVAPANPPPAATPSPEEISLQGFAAASPFCLEWSDGCAVCARDDLAVAHCSTPGIACQPGPISCRREKPK
jgi:hypothetical protein